MVYNKVNGLLVETAVIIEYSVNNNYNPLLSLSQGDAENIMAG